MGEEQHATSTSPADLFPTWETHPHDRQGLATRHPSSLAFQQQHRPYQVRDQHGEGSGLQRAAMPFSQDQAAHLGLPYDYYLQTNAENNEAAAAAAAAAAAFSSSHSSMLSSPASWTHDSHGNFEGRSHSRSTVSASGPPGFPPDQGRFVADSVAQSNVSGMAVSTEPFAEHKGGPGAPTQPSQMHWSGSSQGPSRESLWHLDQTIHPSQRQRYGSTEGEHVEIGGPTEYQYAADGAMGGPSWLRSGDEGVPALDFHQKIPQRFSLHDKAATAGWNPNGPYLQTGEQQWSNMQEQNLRTRMQQNQVPDFVPAPGRQYHSGLPLPHRLDEVSDRSQRQFMPAFSEPTLTHHNPMFGESASGMPHPSLQIGGLLPEGQNHLQQDSPLSLDSSADERFPSTASSRTKLLATYPEDNASKHYESKGVLHERYDTHASGATLSSQAASSAYVSAAPSSSYPSDNLAGSTLSQAFTLTHPPAPSNRPVPHLQHPSMVETMHPLASAAHSRQRASTLGAVLGANTHMAAHQRAPSIVQRSLSSDGMTSAALNEEQGGFAAMESQYAHVGSSIIAGFGDHNQNLSALHQQNMSPHMSGSAPSPSFAQQTSSFSGSSSYSPDLWDQRKNKFETHRYQQGKRRDSSGVGGVRDNDSIRLSLALAKTQLSNSSSRGELSHEQIDQHHQQRAQQGQAPHHDLSTTIIEEEEDYGGEIDLSRRQFPENPAMLGNSREVPKLEVQYRDAGDVAADSLPADCSDSFGPQLEGESFHSDLPQAVLQPLTQQYQQQHPFGGVGTIPPSVQRPYRPAVRPSTYQHLDLMDFEDSNPGRFFAEPPTSGFDSERTTSDSFMSTAIRHYITSASRLGLGERTVLIMTSKVAQKSYGAEKRFLCPPPMILLIGSSWWSVCQDSSMIGMRPHQGLPGPPTVLTPPRINIGMSGETNSQDGVLEWATSSGRLIDVGNPSSEMAVSGRCIGKQLYITDADEKRKACETLVSVSVPGLGVHDPRLLGTFASKSIKIISKPSKKRQSNRNVELGIAHGSIVSLFHRLRSQTVSTRYLCVSGAPSWFKGSDGQPFLTLNYRKAPNSVQNDQPSCFVAKMTSWDAFVVYLVDPTKSAVADPNAPAMKPPVMGYPSPPPNALEVPSNGQQSFQIHYNQRIVLQCLNTAAVSPVMVIRKVDKATTVVGGVAASSTMPTAEEALGDPVSQLHKIALEVVDEATPPAPVAAPNGLGGRLSPPGMSGAFLACLNESVGMRRPLEARKWLWPQRMGGNSSNGSRANSPAMASSSASEQQSSTALAAAYAAAATRGSLAQGRYTSSSSGISATTNSGRHSFSGGSGAASGSPYVVPTSQQQQLQHEQQLAEGSSDGGKVRRPRRVSSSLTSPAPQQQQQHRSGSLSNPSPTLAPASKGRRRGQSLSILEWQRAQAKQASGGGSDQPMNPSLSDSVLGDIASGAAWSAEVADSDIWTIVGTDIARHTFYVPPRILGGVRPHASNSDSGIAHLITTPAPSVPITPIPILHSFISPSTPNVSTSTSASTSTSTTAATATASDIPSSTSTVSHSKNNKAVIPSPDRLVTLLGECLSEELHVYFGDWRSTYVQVQSPETILCSPPPSATEAFQVPSIRLPILFVRKDGVIFPTECIYSV